MGNQKFHFVCLACRRCAKRGIAEAYGEHQPLICALCGIAMIGVGKHFSVPRRRDDAGWKKLAWMIEKGWRGGAWPVAPAMNLGEIQEALREKRETNERKMKRVTEENSFEETAQRAWRNARNRQKAIARKNAPAELAAQKLYQDEILARANKA